MEFGWAKSPKKILFRQNLNAEIEELYPSDVISFQISDRKYITAEIQIDEAGSRSPSISSIPESHRYKKNVYLEVLLEGQNKKLFKYSSNKSSTYFFIGQ
jgi:hypothetical protein